MELEEAIQSALDGKAILFAGAGFSLGAKALDGQDFITGWKLAEILSKEAGLENTVSLDDASEFYVQKFGTDKLIDLLKKKFTPSKIAPYHINLAKIPWKRIYTTNYDNIVEIAYRNEKKSITSVTLDFDIYKTPKDKPLCVHLNGSINRLNRETIFNELKLTETSYITSSIETSPWVTDFRYEIELAEAVFFLGFSLYDLDIKRILIESISLKKKCFFVISNKADEAMIMRVSRFGIPLKISVEEFSNLVNLENEKHIPVDGLNESILSINERYLEADHRPISDKDFFDFLLYGTYTERQILEGVRSKKLFYLFRHQIGIILKATEKGERIFTVSSDFGNGKSLFLEGLFLRFLESGYRVFEVKEHSVYTDSDLKKIAQLDGKICISFENYGKWFKEIELFQLNSNGNAIVILTERSATHEVIVDRLRINLGNIEFSEIYLDLLNDGEIDWFLEVFETYGLWGNYAGESLDKKRKYLVNKCGRQIHAILLSLFNSPNIKSKLTELYDQLKINNTHFDFLMSIFILTVMNHQPTLNLLGDIWGAEIINRTNFRRDKTVQQFINFDRDEVILKSPIVSKYFVKNFSDTNKIVSVLLTMARRLNKLTNSKRFNELFKDIVKFSNVQSVLPERGLRQGAIDYYENIKNLERNRNDPHFWLQYAIACTTTLEIIRAKKYFETAYSLANSKDWNLYQIDNHYARFLVVEAIEYLDVNAAMDNFRKAHNINRRQINTIDKLRYPFKNASKYRPFFEKFKQDFNASQLKELELSFQFVLDKILLLPESRQRLEPMRTCKRDMKLLIDLITDETITV